MRIEHVALYVNDLEKTKKIFMEYLGAKSNDGYHNQNEGAKEMLLVEDVDSKEYLTGLFKAMYDELPVHKAHK